MAIVRRTVLVAALGLAGCATTPEAPPPPSVTAQREDCGKGPAPDAASVKALGKRAAGCYNRVLKRYPNARGKLLVRFTVGTCGEIQDVEAVSDRTNDREIAKCVLAEISAWRPPFRPAEPVTIEYPMVFAPGE